MAVLGSGGTGPASGFARLRDRLRELYYGADRRAAVFNWLLLAFDVLTLAFFVAVTFLGDAPWLMEAELALGVVLLLEFAARTVAAPHPARHLLLPSSLADLLVVVSLLLPAVVGNFAFLRILRAVRLLRSHHVLGRLRRHSPFVRRHYRAIRDATDLVVFVFVMSAVVYVQQHGDNPEMRTYVDALYFTVTALTTTGFGDIVPVGTVGRLLTVMIMIVGITLFIRLAQSLLRPAKVEYPCPRCGLLLHDPDAVHCKHCGEQLAIPTEGA